MSRASLMVCASLAVCVSSMARTALAFEPYAPERADTSPSFYVDDSEVETGLYRSGDRGFALQFSAGPAYRNAYGVHFITADLELAIGAQTKVGGIFGRLRFNMGSTAEGLRVIAPGIGFAWELPLGPFRFGPGFDFGFLGYLRETTDNYSGAFGVGPHGHVSWDFATDRPVGGFLTLKGGGEVYFQDRSNPFVPNIGLALGIRYFGKNR